MALDEAVVREMGGDLGSVISDDAMTAILAYANDNIYAAAERVAMLMAARAASVENARVGDVAVSGGKDRYNAFMSLAAMWRLESITNGFTGGDEGGPYAGGISVSDKNGNEALTDRVKPFFSRNNPISSTQVDSNDESA